MEKRHFLALSIGLTFSTISHGMDLPDGLSESDWQHMQSQIQAQQYQAIATPQGGYAAANLAHGWHVSFQENGQTSLKPLKGETAYHINLQLKSLGNLTSETYTKPEKITTDGSQVSYHWDNNITEIWHNSPEQLEQWFEVQHQPSHAKGDQPLTLTMALNSNLEINQQGNQLKFEDKITYNKLKVWDSNKVELPATMDFSKNQLSLIIDDSQATYPITIDPSFQQVAYLKANNAESGDHFGHSIAISGDTIVVGAPFEDSNGTANNNSANAAGAAYVFYRYNRGLFVFPPPAPTRWKLEARLKDVVPAINNNFGMSVAIDGNTVVVGNPGDFGNEGSAVVFNRTISVFNLASWAVQTVLISGSPDSDQFGTSVAIDGDNIIVGAPFEDSNATGVNSTIVVSDESNNSSLNSGAAYIYTLTGGVWVREAYLKASNTGANDEFGTSVDIQDTRAIVGAPKEDSQGGGSGAAYIFSNANTLGGVWFPLSPAKIIASNGDAGDRFGSAVVTSNGRFVVGAPREDSTSSGINSTSNNIGNNSGAVYSFRPSGIFINFTWSQEAYIKAKYPTDHDFFGSNLSFSGNKLLVGARFEDSDSVGSNDRDQNISAGNAGAAYLFERAATGFAQLGTWTQEEYLKASNTDAADQFGLSVAIDGDTIAIGAPFESSNATGTNNGVSDNTASEAGAAYVFDLFSTAGPGDCNDDGAVDTLDVTCTIDLILNP